MIRVFKLILIVSFVFISTLPFRANALYEASSVLGQTDGVGGVFTTNDVSNNHANRKGFNYPFGLTMDTVNHRLFVSDNANNRVLIYSLNEENELDDYIADYVIGQVDFVSSTSGLSQNRMSNNSSMAYDPVNNYLFITETNNRRVLVFDLSLGITNGMNASFVLGQEDFISNVNATSQDGMAGPSSVAYDSSSKYLFVGDEANSRILVFNLSSGIINGMNASYVLGQEDFVSDARVLTQDGLSIPYGLTYDSNNDRLFVNDDLNDRVLVFDVGGGITNGMDASYVLGQLDFISNPWSTASSSSLIASSQLAYDHINNFLFVGDYYFNRVLVFNLSNGITNGMAGSYVLGQSNFTSTTGSTTQSRLYDPEVGMFYDETNQNLWLTDSSNNRVLMFDMSGGITNNMPATDVLGQTDVEGEPDFDTNNANNIIATNNSGMNFPFGLKLDTTNHRLFVSDCNNRRVLVFNLNSDNNLIDHEADYVIGQDNFISNVSATTQNGLKCVGDIDIDEENELLFVNDGGNHRVLVYDLSSGITNGMNATYVLGQSMFTTATSDSTSSKFNSPLSISHDSINNRLFVADNSNSRITIFDLSNGITNGMSASYVLGQASLTDSIPELDQASLSNPFDLQYVESEQKLYVADTSNERIMIFDLSNGITNGMNALYVLGQPDFISVNWETASSTAIDPEALVYDFENKQLFVADNSNSRITIFDLSGDIANGMAASAVIGVPDFDTVGDCDVSRSVVCDPEIGMSYDSGNSRLWLTDDSNNRVLAFDFIKLSGTVTSSGTAGVYYSSNFLSTSQSQGTVSFALSSGSLPPGLSLNSSTGALTGTPTTAGIYTFNIKAIDDIGTQGEIFDVEEFSITVGGDSLGGHSSGGSSGSRTKSTNSTPVVNTIISNSTPIIVPGCPQGFVCTPTTLTNTYQPSININLSSYTRNLTLNSTGNDVKALQVYLNSKGYIISESGGGSPGNETTFFGPKTKAALSKFQAAKGIIPAAGYFGPLTRTYVQTHP